jgi:Fic family protein
MPSYRPAFKVSRKMLSNLTRIAAAREVILGARLVPKWEVALRRDALLRTAHASTSIEGNRMTLSQVTDLAVGREVMATRQDRQEVLNYLHVLEHLSDYAEDGAVTEKAILRLQGRITKGVLDDPDSGRYRDRQVYIGNSMTGEVRYTPPATSEVPSLVQAMVAWLESDEAKGLDPVVVAGIAHYELVRIHPFIDGNGRTARALASLILLERGFDIKRFFALDDYHDADRQDYYAALRTAEGGDLTEWLDYFTDGVAVSVDAVREKVMRLGSGKLRKDKSGQIALTERQMAIIERTQRDGRITVGEVAEMYGITRQAALKEMSKLASMGVVKLAGKGRGAHYVIR